MSRRDHGSPTLSVVLAGAVIVAAVLFPVFASRHPLIGTDTCLSHERQLGLALVQYAQDSDGQFPVGTQGGGEGWGGQVFPYVRDARAYHCSEDPTQEGTGQFAVSYAYNSNVAARPERSQFSMPARTVLLFEVTHDVADVPDWDESASEGAASFSAAGDGAEGSLLSGRGDVRYATGLLGDRPAAEFSQFDPPRHENGADFLMADGHARWLPPGEVSGGRDAAFAVAPQMGGAQGTAAGTADTGYAATFSVR